MDIFREHEIFEIEVLDLLHRSGLLAPLVFGGGTMLRLCHELNRYSVDLDFWFIKAVPEDEYFLQLRGVLEKSHELTDAQLKHHTLLLELRSARYPKRLKIEIRRAVVQWDYQEKIAFSRFSTRQVIVKALTLEQCMRNKIAALTDRGEIRDCFDIEFLLRRGIPLPDLDNSAPVLIRKKLQGFKRADYAVKLGSILEEPIRQYYVTRGFAYLREKLDQQL